MSESSEVDQAKKLIGALLRMPPRPHADMKLNKPPKPPKIKRSRPGRPPKKSVKS